MISWSRYSWILNGVNLLGVYLSEAQVRGLVFERIVRKGEQAVATLPDAGNPVDGGKC